VVGIDLGTTFSCVGVLRDGRVEIIANAEGDRTTPSVVAFVGEERLIGRAAALQASANPKNTVFDAKRLIGQTFSDPQVQRDIRHFPFDVVKGDGDIPLIQVEYRGATRRFRPEEISAMVLEKMKQTAEAFLGEPVTRAVVTVPAYFNDAQRQATKAAGAIAGLEVLRIVNEPTAAALAYGLDKHDWVEREASGGTASRDATGTVKDASNVLIFDLGGGTFDVSLLRIEDGLFEVVGVSGDTHLGGEDFDNALVEHCCQVVSRTHGFDLKASPSTLRRLRTACERAKRTLSRETSVDIVVEGAMDGADACVHVSRAKFESLNKYLFERCLETVNKVLRDAAVLPKQVSDVVLVGGSTRIPKIQEMLSAHFGGKPLCRDINPDEAVAYGAAVQGGVLSGEGSSTTQDLLLVDVTPLSLGIETTGGVMSTILKRNTSIPCRQTARYSTEDDFQTSIDVRVFEGERSMVKDNNFLGEFNVSGIKNAKAGEPKIDVTFELDANGILNVSARDADTGAHAHTVIANSPGHISADEIARMIRVAEENRKSDLAALERAEAKTELEQLLRLLREQAGPVPSGPLRDLIGAADSWLGSSLIGSASAMDFRRKMEELLPHVGY
jgi:heat shock 70kDa protein 1/2/6/8